MSENKPHCASCKSLDWEYVELGGGLCHCWSCGALWDCVHPDKIRGFGRRRERVVKCPPGDAEPRDPGWEADKPFERIGFRELDEYADDPENRPGGVDRTERMR